VHPFCDLEGRVALVTGGGGAIGGASARALAGAAADVVVVDLRADAAEAVAGQVRGIGRRALALVGDAIDYDHAGTLARQALATLGYEAIIAESRSSRSARSQSSTSAPWPPPRER
jgi:NAD(P)-dependent dehydrogenase (short-subunit alcohol dehydrogenase family)